MKGHLLQNIQEWQILSVRCTVYDNVSRLHIENRRQETTIITGQITVKISYSYFLKTKFPRYLSSKELYDSMGSTPCRVSNDAAPPDLHSFIIYMGFFVIVVALVVFVFFLDRVSLCTFGAFSELTL